MENREIRPFNSSTPIEDRFSFHTQGRFQCARSTEGILIAAVIVLAIVVWLIIYDLMGQQFKFVFYMHEKTDHAFFFAIAFAFITLALVLITVFMIKAIMNGIEYHYTADSNMFSFYSEKAGVKKTDIHYYDVVSITYDQLILFGMIDRGFIVSITTHSLGTITLEYIYNKSIRARGHENTPFHIIEKRIEMLSEKN